MTRTKFLILPLILIVALASFGCAAKQNTTAGTPTTPLQRVAVLNAELAKVNRSAETAVEQLQTSGVLTVAQARPVITVNLKVAQVSDAISKIVQGPGDWANDAAQIKAALDASGLSAELAKAGVPDATLTALLQDAAALVNLIQSEVNQ